MTILHTLLLLAPLPCIAAGDPAEAPLVLRAYEMRPALPWRSETPMGLTLFPRLLAQHGQGFESDEGGVDPENLVAFLREAYSAEFEQQGRSLDYDEQLRLIVRAPEDVHKGVAQMLGFWEGLFTSGSELIVDVALADSPPASAPACLVGPAEADKALAAWGPPARRASFRLRIAPGGVGSLDASGSVELVCDFNPEIAQASAVLDPVTESVRTGLRLLARAAPAPGGLWLALVSSSADPVGEVRTGMLRGAALITNEQGSNTQSLARSLQALDVENRSFAINAFLPEGKVLLVQTTTHAQLTRSSALLAIRAVGPTPARDHKLALEGVPEKNALSVHNWQFAVPPRMSIEATGLAAIGFPRALALRGDLDVWFNALLYEPQPELALNLLQDDRHQFTSWGPFMVVHLSPFAPADAPDTSVDRPLALSRLAPSTRQTQITLRLRRGTGEGSTIAQAVLPVRIGESGVVVLGTESHTVCDYDVEVAQSATVCDPIVADSFDGALFAVHPELGRRGELIVRVECNARVQRGPLSSFDANSPVIGPVQLATYDVRAWSERLVFAKEGAKVQVLGDTLGGGLALEVEAFELR